MKAFQNKAVLITGATGLLGSHLVEQLLQVGCSAVYAMGRNKQKLVKTFNAHERLFLVEHDIAAPLPPALGHLDFIFHAASPISGAVITNSPVDVINANLNGTINCLTYLKQQSGGKMIVFSSATVYDGTAGEMTLAGENCTQYATPISSPNAPYAESKRMIEVIANAYSKQYGIDVLIARFSYLYGYAPNAPKTAFYEFLFHALRNEPITLNKGGLPRRDNIYIDDAVEALLHLCKTGDWGNTYNISSCGDNGNYAAIDEIAEIIAQEANKINNAPGVGVHYSSPAATTRTEGIRLDNSKLKASGWAIKTSLQEGIRKTLQKYKGIL